MDNGIAIGIDLGRCSVKAVAVDRTDGRILRRAYGPHRGDPHAVLLSIVEGWQDLGRVRMTVTGSIPKGDFPWTEIPWMDLIPALWIGVRRCVPDVRHVVDVGAGAMTLIDGDERGEIQGVSSNGLCAAGTGSFLDNQAARLGLDPWNVSLEGLDGDPPSIATRCAVFAKSDLIHRQQEGYSKIEMWSGLCKGMAETLRTALLQGRPLRGPVALTGGVSRNPWVLQWLKRILGEKALLPVAEGHLAAAFGAALEASRKDLAEARPMAEDWVRILSVRPRRRGVPLRAAPLQWQKGHPPEEGPERPSTDEEGNEIRIHPRMDIHGSGPVRVFAGIDVGSTSTKLCLIDPEGEILVDLYRKTEGSPVAATQSLFQALLRIEEERGITFQVLGCATTGSGRRLVGLIVGADEIVNEITAHARGAVWIDPDIETLFEIGGQDAKYISLRDGEVVDANMNFVCAAGTGSFLEEQAGRLGIPVWEIERKALGIRPPYSSDRCTVFMEQDIDRFLMMGFRPEECLAAAVYSVAENYLNRVVGNRPVSSRRVLFQGATARNRALAAAFEQLLHVEVVISPHCHVMGAYGAALLAREGFLSGSCRTRFRGFDLGTRTIQYEHRDCTLCPNRCPITYARIQGEGECPSWGYRCGREPEESKRREWETFRIFEERARFRGIRGPETMPDRPRIGIPRALTNWGSYPLWQRFFSSLGFRTVLSPPSDEATLKEGALISKGDLCLPVKMALGHVRRLLEGSVDYVFLPHFISDKVGFGKTHSYFCPMVQGFPSLAWSALKGSGLPLEKCLTPVVDLRLSPRNFLRCLWKGIGEALDRDPSAIRTAWEEGARAQREFARACQERGREWMDSIRKRQEIGVVLLGRPYVLFDSRISLDVSRRIASYGIPVLPMDHIPDDPALGEPYGNLYWSYGQKILQALRWAREEGLFPVYLTTFHCGPDSFLLSYAEWEMRGRPFLILEFDEHCSDVSHATRIEAFLDTLKRRRSPSGQAPKGPIQEGGRVFFPRTDRSNLIRRTIWIPPLSPAASRLFAASFRAFGYRAEALSTEREEDFRLGRSLTRGTECLPLITTTGVLVRTLRELRADPRDHAFFMASAMGPCRFGQYVLLQRMILNRLGYGEIPILSPSSHNAYQGLDEGLRRRLYESFVVSDILTKCLHRTRPYEVRKGEAERVFEDGLQKLERRFESGASLRGAVREVVRAFEGVDTFRGKRPLVGIVGEIYIRCNPFCNEELIRTIEELGGEAWLVPTLEWMLYSTTMQRWNFRVRRGGIGSEIRASLRNRYMERAERRFYEEALPFLQGRIEPSIHEVLEEGGRVIPIHFQGEAILTIGRALLFAREGVSAIVNCLPFSCMPGTLTSAIFQGLQLQEEFRIPVANVTYDGKGGANEGLALLFRTRGFPLSDDPSNAMAGFDRGRV